MNPENKIINGLWIGAKLSALELLTVHSFVNHGHIFHLWVYNEMDNDFPENVLLKDANEIIPESEIFRKKEADPKIGNGKGGLGMFADLFRYKLLYEKGGWWVDMDVTCLKMFDFEESYFFRSHPYLPMVNNVMKCPSHSEIMKIAYDESLQKTSPESKSYLIANEILNENIRKLGLDKYIHNNICNREWWTDIEHYMFSKKQPPANWYFIHWINEEWRTQNINKNELYQNSTIGAFMNKYGINVQLKANDMKYLAWNIKQSKVLQKLKPFLKKTPFYSLYKNHMQ